MTSRTAIALFASLLSAGCSVGRGGRGDDAPDTGLRLWAPPVLHWDAGRARDLEFAIENGTRRTLRLPAVDPAHARVDVFAGPESLRVCGVEPRPARAARGGPGAAVGLEPGDRVAVRVDLEEACAGVPAGDYRYEVSYRVPESGGSDAVAGALPTRYGQIVVEAGEREAAPRRVRARSARPDRRAGGPAPAVGGGEGR